ncbi:hypothetical protein [Thermococcus gorgonarius]|uniref:Uncharacterized protein n=1 Tax=Thermococcus gorgonarius TaxID=71997 RepID=A0A2Z2MFR0_THEGO|nr:hypothetical protein [Thermococcus gorgonarius]ASJ01301.1 hypothetical protein A3K92_07310 [Thermococcus gorgonarius]
MRGDKRKKSKIEELIKKGLGTSEIARQLGVTPAYVSKVKREIRNKRMINEGEREAEVFKLLKEGKSPVDIVIELKLPAEEVNRIYEKYLELNNLPPVTQLDIMDYVDESCESIREEILGEIREYIQRAITEVHRKLSKDVEEIQAKTEELGKEKDDMKKLLIWSIGELSRILAQISIESLIERMIVVQSFPETLSKSQLSMYQEAAEDACKMFILSNPNPSEVQKIVSKLETFKQSFEMSGDKEAVNRINVLLKILTKYQVKTG